MSAGKGDKPRPVKKIKFDNNFISIQWIEPNKEQKSCIIKKGKKIYRYL